MCWAESFTVVPAISMIEGHHSTPFTLPKRLVPSTICFRTSGSNPLLPENMRLVAQAHPVIMPKDHVLYTYNMVNHRTDMILWQRPRQWNRVHCRGKKISPNGKRFHYSDGILHRIVPLFSHKDQHFRQVAALCIFTWWKNNCQDDRHDLHFQPQ